MRLCFAENSDGMIGMPNHKEVCMVPWRLFGLFRREGRSESFAGNSTIFTLGEEGEDGWVVGRGKEGVETGMGIVRQSS